LFVHLARKKRDVLSLVGKYLNVTDVSIRLL